MDKHGLVISERRRGDMVIHIGPYTRTERSVSFFSLAVNASRVGGCSGRRWACAGPAFLLHEVPVVLECLHLLG